jgi:hypothetical protein
MGMETGRITEAPRARITGIVYLLYFTTAILAQVCISRQLFVQGKALNLIAYALYAVLTLLLYALFKPVNSRVSLLAACFSLAGCTIGVLDLVLHAPVHTSPLLFFGFYCLLLGCLILRSTFLPRLLGWLMVFAGLGWLAFLSPPIALHLGLVIEILGILAEASLMLWLLLRGVNLPRWREQASAAGALPRT